MRVGFMNHPLGAVQDWTRPTAARDGDWQAQQNNIYAAYEWMRFVTRYVVPKIAVLAPAIPWVAAEIDGVDILKMMVATLPRADFAFDVNWSSPHMGILRNHARNNQQPVIDLTRWGSRPPWDESDEIKAINEKFAEIRFVKKRAVWLPPLSASDIAALRDAGEKLVEDPENIVAAQVLQSIINAAAKP